MTPEEALYRIGESSADAVVRALEAYCPGAVISHPPVVLDEDADPVAGVPLPAVMADVVVQLRAEVGSVDMPLEKVLALAPGDILRLDGATEEGAVTLYADAIALHRAKLGRNGRRRAVGVLGPVQEDA
jgi:flagellar motor switch/type III secretory pathway protein FliN